MFQEYLREILKRLTDKEEIVQEAACTSLSVIISCKKERLVPFLFDTFKVDIIIILIYLFRLYQMFFHYIKELAF